MSEIVKRLGFLAVLALLGLAACSEAQTGQPAPLAATETSEEAAQVQPTATARPASTPTVEAIRPMISVEDQRLEEDGLLSISRVVTGERGSWLAVHIDDEGQPGPVLGTTFLSEGEHRGVTVEVDPLAVSPRLFARLYEDAGRIGQFEFPGADRPLQVNAEQVFAAFQVDVRAPIPTLIVADQSVAEDGAVLIDRVVAARSGFLALQLDDDGSPSDILNFTPVPKGASETITMTIPWRQATPTIHAVLYDDSGQVGHFDPGSEDRPVTVNDHVVATAVKIRMPPDIYALPQPIIDGILEVERAVSYGPGWLVVHREEDGESGSIIGFAPLQDGINTRVPVSVTQSAVTERVYLALHEDTGDVGEFGYPVTDLPVLYQGRLPQPVAVETVPGNYLIARDQVLIGEQPVNVPFVVLDVDGWLVIQAAERGEPGKILGQTPLASGFHRDVTVGLDFEPPTEMVFAVLYLDAQPLGEFDFPDGDDVPLQRNRSVVQVMFAVTVEQVAGE